jgi:hypothetical protein
LAPKLNYVFGLLKSVVAKLDDIPPCSSAARWPGEMSQIGWLVVTGGVVVDGGAVVVGAVVLTGAGAVVGAVDVFGFGELLVKR